MDHFLQPIVHLIPEYLWYTKDFISKVENLSIPTESVLVTLDVTALYTNIPHNDARHCVQMALDCRSSQDPSPPTHCLLDHTDIILGKKNHFEDHFLF